MTGNSGTNFNRPQFKQMISDIEDGKIDIVITKDLSRLGREYLQTPEGQRCLPDPERRKKQKRVRRAENGQQHDRADEHAAHAQLLSL